MLQAGDGHIAGGKVSISSASGSDSIEISSGAVKVKSEQITLTVPKGTVGDVNVGMIGLGVTDAKTGAQKIDLRVYSKQNGESSIIVSAPLEVSSVRYAADSRIARDIKPVDRNDLLQKFKKVNVRSFGLTPEWLAAQGRSPSDVDERTRGIIAEELATVFPEYVHIVSDYRLDDRDFAMDNFQEIDKTGLLTDLICCFPGPNRQLRCRRRFARQRW